MTLSKPFLLNPESRNILSTIRPLARHTPINATHLREQ